MKVLKYTSLRAFTVAALALVLAVSAKVQITDNDYASIDWQFNFPLNNHSANKTSGQGMNFEDGYFLVSNFALGGFLSHHGNHEHFDRQTLPAGESDSLNTDQQRTVFQLPFGPATRYAWNRGGASQPYVDVRLGAQYAQLRSTFNAFGANEDTWGLHVSLETGFNVYPWAYGPGLYFAAYYSYGTDKSDLFTYDVDGMNNVSLRTGIVF